MKLFQTKVTETSRPHFIPDGYDPELGRERLDRECGNFDIVTRTLWVKFWKLFWFPIFTQTKMFFIPGVVWARTALGDSYNYDSPEKPWII